MAVTGKIVGIAVTVGGVKVGTAIIESGGKIVIQIDEKYDQVGQLIGDLLELGFADGISVNPNLVPAQEASKWRSAMQVD